MTRYCDSDGDYCVDYWPWPSNDPLLIEGKPIIIDDLVIDLLIETLLIESIDETESIIVIGIGIIVVIIVNYDWYCLTNSYCESIVEDLEEPHWMCIIDGQWLTIVVIDIYYDLPHCGRRCEGSVMRKLLLFWRYYWHYDNYYSDDNYYQRQCVKIIGGNIGDSWHTIDLIIAVCDGNCYYDWREEGIVDPVPILLIEHYWWRDSITLLTKNHCYWSIVIITWRIFNYYCDPIVI